MSIDNEQWEEGIKTYDTLKGKLHTGNERYSTTVQSAQDNGVTYSTKYYGSISNVRL